jgi:hypothetical protein
MEKHNEKTPLYRYIEILCTHTKITVFVLLSRKKGIRKFMKECHHSSSSSSSSSVSSDSSGFSSANVYLIYFPFLGSF